MAKKKLNKRQWILFRFMGRVLRMGLLMILTVAVFVGVVNLINWYDAGRKNPMKKMEESEYNLDGIELNNGVKIRQDFLVPNQYSRPETTIKKVNAIVIHYVGNPGTTAQNNRDYFEGLANSGKTYASSNFVVGLKGEIIQCIPINEVAYCSNHRNNDTLSIEVCHPKADGKFKKATYRSVVELTAYLCHLFELSSDDVIRHYDVTGKLCPLYYVEHEDAWMKLIEDVEHALQNYK